MHIFTAAAAAAAAPGLACLSSQIFATENTTTSSSNNQHHPSLPLNFPKSRNSNSRRSSLCIPRVSSSAPAGVKTQAVEQPPIATADDSPDHHHTRPPPASPSSRISADWKTAMTFLRRGLIYQGRVEGFNGGGLLVRFRSLSGFLPFSQLSPSHSCKEPQKSIPEIARALTGSPIYVKVLQADEENRKLILSEKEAAWSKFSPHINVGDICKARVGSVEDYGAFLHLRFPDGCYHLTGLVHVSEVSWDLVQDVRDILNEGDDVRAKIIKIDREKSRITLSLKQLEEDPLLETLDKVIPQIESLGSDSLSTGDIFDIEPLPGLETIIQELLQEDGINDITITRQGFEKRVVSQDLQLWLSNAPPIGNQFTLLARAGRQVQEILLTTALDQEGIKKALQRVLERVP